MHLIFLHKNYSKRVIFAERKWKYGCKETKASAIKKEIATQILHEGKAIPNSRVIPMARLIKYLGIDEKRIVKNAKLEAEILK